MKELSQSDFSTRIIKDLGMLQPEGTKRKMRYVELECLHCSNGFILTVDNAKRRQETTCSTCKIWYEDASMIRLPVYVNDTKTAEFKCSCCENTVTYTKQLAKVVKTVLCKDCSNPLSATKQSEVSYAELLNNFTFTDGSIISNSTKKSLCVYPDGRCSVGGVKIVAARVAYMLQHKVDIGDKSVYTVDGDLQNLTKTNLTLSYKNSLGYRRQISRSKPLYSLEEMQEVSVQCSSRTEFKEKYLSMYTYALRSNMLEDVLRNIPKQHIVWDDESAMSVAIKYSTREALKHGDPKAYEYIQKRSEDRDRFYSHMTWNSPSDNNVIYIWRVIGLNDVYKIGVTSSRLGDLRISTVAKEGFLDYEIVLITAVKGKATDLEKVLLLIGESYKFDRSFNGSTEFRVLNCQEVNKVIKIIKDNIDDTKI